MGCTNINASKKLTDFLSFYDEAISIYNYCYDKVNECDNLKCDLLHLLELSKYQDRNEERRIQTQLKYCLKDRRYYKDRVEELEPFTSLFILNNKDKDKENLVRQCCTTINHLKQSLGTIRKVETYHQNRKYKPRILKDNFGE